MSILTHQKRLWFFAGASFAGLGLFTLERDTWQGVAQITSLLPLQPAPIFDQGAVEPLFGPQFWNGITRQWNSGVDAVFHPIVKHLTERGL